MATRRRYRQSAKIKRWKVLKVAARTRNITLALRAIGLRKLPAAMRRLYTPQTEAARRQGFWPVSRVRTRRRRR